MRVTTEVEVGEIRDRVGRATRRHLARPDEPSETLSHFNVHQVRRMELVFLPKKARLDASANRRLQEEL